jgi:hypothetical protein
MREEIDDSADGGPQAGGGLLGYVDCPCTAGTNVASKSSETV